MEKKTVTRNRPLLRTKQAATYLGIGEKKLRDLVDQGRIKYAKFGDHSNAPLLFDPAWLEAFIAERTVEPW